MSASAVTSQDGTPIAYWSSGHGRPILIVHGLGASHLSWMPFVDALRDACTVCTYDRRGRGESGDDAPYAFEREVDDLLAVATALGAEVVLGHSLGGALALEAALTSDSIRALIVVEGWASPLTTIPDDVLEGIERLVSDGRLADAFHYGDSPEDVEVARELPDYAQRVASVHTYPREIRGWERYWLEHPVDDDRWRGLDRPVLLLLGEQGQESTKPPAELLAQRMPSATIRVLEGQGHQVYLESPELLAREVREWLSGI